MKIYLSKINESWIVDRVRKEWYQNNQEISTKNIRNSDIVWIISPWLWRNIPTKYLTSKKVICSIYHIDFENFDSTQKADFLSLDKYVDEYHVISQKTLISLQTLTNKKITSIPFWVNQKNYFYKENKDILRKKLGFEANEFLVGSFQRDTEGKDLESPKLIKGPDIFIEIVNKLKENRKDLKVVLAGTRRQYVIKQLEKSDIPFKYFEMAKLKKLNDLYNILDLYIVSSRLEGGPQAIVECAVIKCPLISTDVGIAKEILNPKSIYDPNNFKTAIPDVEYAFRKSKDLSIPNGMINFVKMFRKLYES